jgi:hypothetical protein
MKGFLTFTLAAGVAITTTSIAQAAGVGKGVLNADRTVSSQSQAPMGIGALGGLTLDRAALNRELDRLNALLEPMDGDVEGAAASVPVQRKTIGTWTY